MELPVLLAILATIAVGTYFQTVTGFGLGIIVIGLTVSLNLVSLPVIAAVVSIVTLFNCFVALMGKPLMLYVFSDGSVFSNGMIDSSVNGRGKGVWTGDNSSTAASFFLVYDPVAQQTAIRQQVGWMRSDASVETTATPAANNVNLLVETVILNYMALHGEEGSFDQAGVFPSHGLGSSTNWANYLAFGQIDSVTGGQIT